MKVETLFLDAGGVLVNPNFERVADALRANGVPAEGAALRRAEAWLFDVAGLYPEADCPRVASLTELADRLG